MKSQQRIRILASLAVGAILSGGSTTLLAQNYPDLTHGGQVTSYVQQCNHVSSSSLPCDTDSFETFSPAIASDTTGTLWMAYFNTNHLLTVASSTDGTHFTVYPVSGDYYLVNSAPTWVLINGTLYVTFITDSPNFNLEFESLDTATGVLTPQGSLNTGSTGAYAHRPAVAYDPASGYIYAAWMAKMWDPGSSSQTGHWIDAAVAQQGLGNLTINAVTPISYLLAPISTSYSAGSAPALTLYGGTMYLTYLDAATGNPQMFGVSSFPSTSFSDLTGPGGGNGHFAGDPATVAAGGTLFAMFRSAYTPDNLWAIGTTNGSAFGPQYMYGQTLQYSPSLTTTPTGTLYQAEFTNYPASGNYDWVYYSPGNTIDPTPHDVGGGGDPGDPGDPGNGCVRLKNGTVVCNQL